MSLRSKWIDRIYRIATGSKKFRNLLTPTGAIFYGLFTALFVIAGLHIDSFFNLPKLFAKPLDVILSVPVFCMAVLLIGWSVLHFIKAQGTPVPFNPPPQLVTSGPYALARNPMLTGVFMVILGFGILFGSVSVIFVFMPLFILVNVWELKAIEEPELARRLGEEYVEYKKKTPMFFPDLGVKIKRRK